MKKKKKVVKGDTYPVDIAKETTAALHGKSSESCKDFFSMLKSIYSFIQAFIFPF